MIIWIKNKVHDGTIRLDYQQKEFKFNENIVSKKIELAKSFKAKKDHIIKINNIEFQLLKKFSKKNRKFIVIRSIDNNLEDFKERMFEVYSSNSEGGIIRLCTYSNIFNHIDKRYEKGHDYVTSSWINIELQKLIYDKYDKIDILQETDRYYKQVCANFNICGFNGKNEIITLLEDEKRIIEEPIFEPLRKCKSGSCFLINELRLYIYELDEKKLIELFKEIYIEL